MSEYNEKPIRVAFIHPDLGIGGAERLVVDAALGFQEKGYQVDMITSHCDKKHCFEEIKDGTLKVQVFGDQFPTNFMNKFFIVFANIRQLYLISQLIKTKQIDDYDLFVVDQLSTCVPFLHVFARGKILFYCHFPDQALSQRTNFLKKLYRIPFDLFEQFSISAADKIVVNSEFTKSIYKKTFTFLTNEPDVIYPCVSTETTLIEAIDRKLLDKFVKPHDKFYLSINRYERKKHIKLALMGFAVSKEAQNDNAKLIICGGYDERVKENVDYLKELEKETEKLKLSYTTISYSEFEKTKDLSAINAQDSKVIYLTSISTSLKELLLSRMEMLLYTPSFEHFGIVPLEAMKHGKPVLAVNNGGPIETVVSYIPGKNEDTTTGWLREPTPEVWATVINQYLTCGDIDFKSNGEQRVEKYYTRDVMAWTFEDKIDKIIWHKKKNLYWENIVFALIRFFVHMVVQFIFPGESWPYLLLLGFSFVYLKDIMGGIYWTFIFILTSDLLSL